MAINLSPKFAFVLLIIHAVVAIVVCLTSMTLPAKSFLLLLVISSSAYHFARDVFLLLSNSWREITLVPDGVRITTQGGLRTYGQVVSKTTVSPYFVVLVVRLEGRCFTDSRVIFPDALGKDVFRELCILLRFS